MTVNVTRSDGETDNYMRFGDAYVKHQDGSLDVVRGGSNSPYRYAAGDWADVTGDEKGWQKARFWKFPRRSPS